MPPEWSHRLWFRWGAPSRLAGIRVYHDFPWTQFFPDSRTQFNNGMSLAHKLIQRCPDGKSPALLLTADGNAREGLIETDDEFVLVIRIEEFLRQRNLDAVASYLARNAPISIAAVDRYSELSATPEALATFLELHLNSDHVRVCDFTA